MRVAFVDPSKTNRAAITRLLQSGGHEVLLFSDGHNALDRLRGDASVEALITSAELPRTFRSRGLLGSTTSGKCEPADLRVNDVIEVGYRGTSVGLRS